MRALMLVLFLVAWSAAQEPDFDAELEKIRTLVERGRFDSAQRMLDTLLEENKGSNPLRARKERLVSLFETCAFRAEYPEPDPKGLISGELLSYSSSSGRIGVRYTPDTMRDWRTMRGYWMHPASFRGPHRLRIRGQAYPGGNGVAAIACLAAKDGFVVIFGREQVTIGTQATWIPSYLRRLTGDEPEQVDYKETSPCRTGKRFDLIVKVSSRAISASYNGRQILSGRKPDDLWGPIGFTSGLTFDEVLLEGEAEPSWIQRLMDAASVQQRQEFAKSWKAEEHLPAWVFEQPGVAVDLAVPEDREWPGKVDPGHASTLERAQRFLKQDAFRDGLEFLRSLGDGRIGEPQRQWLLASFLDGLGQPGEALQAARKVTGHDGSFFPARELEGRLLVELARFDEAVPLLEGLAERYPGSAAAQEALASALMLSGRMEQAKQVVERSVARGVSSDELTAMGATVTRALAGPPWRTRHEYNSANYHVASDIDRSTCEEAARLLEESYLAYRVNLEPVKDLVRHRFQVFLFSGELGYQSYCHDLWGFKATHTAGLYSPVTKQLLIWNLPDRAAMMRTVRHEGLHQYLDRLMHHPPHWFNEGLAEYYETAEQVAGTWRLGEPRQDHLETLSRGMIPLNELLFLTPREFMAQAFRNYAESWAFIHFLRHGPREYQDLFDAFWEAFKADPDNTAATWKALGDLNLDALQRAFKAHVAMLKR